MSEIDEMRKFFENALERGEITDNQFAEIFPTPMEGSPDLPF